LSARLSDLNAKNALHDRAIEQSHDQKSRLEQEIKDLKNERTLCFKEMSQLRSVINEAEVTLKFNEDSLPEKEKRLKEAEDEALACEDKVIVSNKDLQNKQEELTEVQE